jgi:hypothetical protein
MTARDVDPMLARSMSTVILFCRMHSNKMNTTDAIVCSTFVRVSFDEYVDDHPYEHVAIDVCFVSVRHEYLYRQNVHRREEFESD